MLRRFNAIRAFYIMRTRAREVRIAEGASIALSVDCLSANSIGFDAGEFYFGGVGFHSRDSL